MCGSAVSRLGLGSIAMFLAIAFMILPASTEAQEDWRNDIGTFRIGVVGGNNPAELLTRLEPFRLAVEEELKVPVSILPSANLKSLVERHVNGRNEYAILSASAYAAGWVNCECIEPLVVAKSSDGSTGVHSIIIVRKTANISSPQGLAGKTIVTLGTNATLGYSFPIHQLQQQKIDLMSGETQFVFTETAEEALRRFAGGEGDALFGWTSMTGDAETGFSRGTLNRLLPILPDGGDEAMIVWRSDKVPHRVHSIRKNLAGEPKKLLRNLLIRLFEDDPIAFDSVEPEFGGGFEQIAQDDFEPMVEFVRNAVPKKLETALETGGSNETVRQPISE